MQYQTAALVNSLETANEATQQLFDDREEQLNQIREEAAAAQETLAKSSSIALRAASLPGDLAAA